MMWSIDPAGGLDPGYVAVLITIVKRDEQFTQGGVGKKAHTVGL